jgi:hypothetical protein
MQFLHDGEWIDVPDAAVDLIRASERERVVQKVKALPYWFSRDSCISVIRNDSNPCSEIPTPELAYREGYEQGRKDQANTCILCGKQFTGVPHINCMDSMYGTTAHSNWTNNV